MKQPEVGKPPKVEDERDAIHVALYPATAGEYLQPGQKVRLSRVSGHAIAGDPCAFFGVVDPFRVTPVLEGERFWLFIAPGRITGLRHVYTCPEIDGREGNKVS